MAAIYCLKTQKDLLNALSENAIGLLIAPGKKGLFHTTVI